LRPVMTRSPSNLSCINAIRSTMAWKSGVGISARTRLSRACTSSMMASSHECARSPLRSRLLPLAVQSRVPSSSVWPVRPPRAWLPTSPRLRPPRTWT
jgi:hypothetical protein